MYRKPYPVHLYTPHSGKVNFVCSSWRFICSMGLIELYNMALETATKEEKGTGKKLKYCFRVNLPSCVSCMNSNSLLTTVLRNFQCALRKRGYCPTIYMISEATTALLSFPRLISQSPRRSLITVTRNRFSCSSSGESNCN